MTSSTGQSKVPSLFARPRVTRVGPEAVEWLGFGEQVVLHLFERCADAVLEWLAGIDQLLDCQLGTLVKRVGGENLSVAVVECRWEILEHATVRKAQNTSLSFGNI
jgi:hypothetical protein